MTTGPAFHSDAEIIKRLQVVLRDVETAPLGSQRAEANEREVRNLTNALAERIQEDPAAWGLDAIPAEYRDDAASDALLALLTAVPELKGRESIADWYSAAAEDAFRRLWSVAEQQASRARPGTSTEVPAPVADGSSSVFESQDGLWQSFEKDFPRDAFALRLRYLLGRSPEDMAVMLDAQSARAITLRLNRARDRFRMFCEQAGYDRYAVEDLVAQISEEQQA